MAQVALVNGPSILLVCLLLCQFVAVPTYLSHFWPAWVPAVLVLGCLPAFLLCVFLVCQSLGCSPTWYGSSALGRRPAPLMKPSLLVLLDVLAGLYQLAVIPLLYQTVIADSYWQVVRSVGEQGFLVFSQLGLCAAPVLHRVAWSEKSVGVMVAQPPLDDDSEASDEAVQPGGHEGQRQDVSVLLFNCGNENMDRAALDAVDITSLFFSTAFFMSPFHTTLPQTFRVLVMISWCVPLVSALFHSVVMGLHFPSSFLC